MNQASHNAPVCKKCGAEKHWVKNKSAKAGGQWGCPACQRENSRRYHQANPGKLAANARAWNQANPEKVAASSRAYRQANRERLAANARARAKANPGKLEANARAWAQANREKVAAHSRAWYKANPEKAAANCHRYLARKRNATVPGREVTAAIEIERKALFGGCCFCGSQEKLTLEHLTPLIKGGLHVAENLLGSCLSCNCSKRDSPVKEWYRAQPFFSEERWSAIKRCTDLDCA